MHLLCPLIPNIKNLKHNRIGVFSLGYDGMYLLELRAQDYRMIRKMVKVN